MGLWKIKCMPQYFKGRKYIIYKESLHVVHTTLTSNAIRVIPDGRREELGGVNRGK